MNPGNSVLETMDDWTRRGWLSHLNRAFARFLQYLDNDAPAPVLWAGALVSHQLDRGEVYLDLEKLSQQPELTLALPTGTAPVSPLRKYNLDEWTAALEKSRLVTDGAGDTPLVLEGNRLYLRRYWRYQQTLNIAIEQRLQPIRNSLPEALLEPLASLFPSAPGGPDWQKTACVLALRARFSIITGGPGTGKTTTLTKLLALLIQLTRYQASATKNPVILLAAPTGKAAARVSESIGKALDNLNISDDIKQAIPTKASTLHRLLGSRPDSRQFIHDRHNPLVADIVIVDEASMIDLEMIASLLAALADNTQLILLGDKDQLASVEAGSVMGDLCHGAEQAAYDDNTLAWINTYAGAKLKATGFEGTGVNQQTVMLRHSHRFGEHSGIGQLAKAVNAGNVKAAISILNDTDRYSDLAPLPRGDYLKLKEQPHPEAAEHLLKKLVSINNGNDAQDQPRPRQGYGYYVDVIRKNRPAESAHYDNWARQVLTAFDTFQVLCALRQGPSGVQGLNSRIEAWLFPKQQSFWYEGRPVMITRNDYNLGLMNGDIGIALKTAEGRLKVAFPGDDPVSDITIRWVSPLRLPTVETAFAITVHKSQGSEFNHVALVLPEIRSPVITRELIYTGITRAKENFTLLESSKDVFRQAILTTYK